LKQRKYISNVTVAWFWWYFISYFY